MTETVIKIKRAAADRRWVQTYTVPVPDDGGLSIMGALDWIRCNVDPTLAYFSHAACHQAACGRCMVKANGKIVLACVTGIAAGEPLVLEPWNEKVIRDLVCEGR